MSCAAVWYKTLFWVYLLIKYVTVFFFLFLSQNPPDWQEILTYFRGSELQNYFTKILEDDLRAIVKPQYVDQIPKTVKVNDFNAAEAGFTDVCSKRNWNNWTAVPFCELLELFSTFVFPWHVAGFILNLWRSAGGTQLQIQLFIDNVRLSLWPRILNLYVWMIGLTVILCLCLQGSVGAILGRKDDTDTQDIVCEQLGKTYTHRALFNHMQLVQWTVFTQEHGAAHNNTKLHNVTHYYTLLD